MYLIKNLQREEDKDFGLGYNCALQIIIFSDLEKNNKGDFFMCGRKKRRDPRIDQEQKTAREGAEAAKEQAEAKKEAERLKLLEMEKEAAATEIATSEANMGKDARQSELELNVINPRTSGLFGSKAAQRRRRSARSGRRGRRSLLTSSGGGMGFYSRFN
jgi:hypothetical protein|tara:strand:+ start:348 stop:827 length:480 start_codon:yes stop_codon:yes gene_type:complete